MDLGDPSGFTLGRDNRTIKATGLNNSPRVIQPATDRFLRCAIKPLATTVSAITITSQFQIDRSLISFVPNDFGYRTKDLIDPPPLKWSDLRYVF